MLWQRGVLLQRLVRIESGIELNRYNRKDALTPGGRYFVGCWNSLR
jgi:hypothetical protein